MLRAKNLLIKVIQIKGQCPVYQVGDAFKIINGYQLISDKPLCMHSLTSLMPYYVALSRGIDPVDLGLAKEGKIAYLQCLDPCEYTGGGTVVFAVESKEAEEQGREGAEAQGARRKGAGEKGSRGDPEPRRVRGI